MEVLNPYYSSAQFTVQTTALTACLCLTHLEYNNSAAFVAGGQQLAIVVELHTRDDVRVGDIVVEGTLYL